MVDTLVLNFWGGPGVGKSTSAAISFGRLKQQGLNTELVPEVAKDLVWEERWKTLTNQSYIAGKQMWRVDRLRGLVDVVVTDGPFLLSLFYMKEEQCAPKEFAAYLKAVFDTWPSVNIFLERAPGRGYNTAGRYQTQDEAEALDDKQHQFLDDLGVEYRSVQVDPDGEEHINQILYYVGGALDELRAQAVTQ